MPGRNALFVPGPTNMPDAIRRAMDVALEDHRAPDFPDLTLGLLRDIKKIFKTEEGSVLIYAASASGGWDAAISNTLSPGDKVLAARYGQFSHLWIETCRQVGMELDVIEVEWGEGVPADAYAERLDADSEHKIKAVLVCHNETATGVTSDVAAVRRALDAANHPALLYVDGVSSIASIDFRMNEWGVDLAVSGSQKGFMMPAGLAFVGVSPKAFAANQSSRCPRAYFDFTQMTGPNASGYFPYTPAATLLRGLRASLDLLLAEGLDNVFARHHRLAEGVRRAVAAWGLELCAKRPALHSDTVSAIRVPDGADADALVKRAYARYNLSLGGGLSQLAGKVFRIGHVGDLNELMVLSALAGTEMALRDVGIDVVAGAGVGAAEEYFRSTARPVEVGQPRAATG